MREKINNSFQFFFVKKENVKIKKLSFLTYTSLFTKKMFQLYLKNIKYFEYLFRFVGITKS